MCYKSLMEFLMSCLVFCRMTDSQLPSSVVKAFDSTIKITNGHQLAEIFLINFTNLTNYFSMKFHPNFYYYFFHF